MIITSHSPSLFSLHSSLFSLHSLTCLHRAICKSPLRQNAKALMLIWDNHFFTTYPSSFAWLHFSLFTLHFSLFTSSRAYIGRFANRPYDRTQKPSCQYGIITFHHIPKLIRLATLFTFHSSLLTPSCAYIGRFANRPYDRTQKPSCQYGIITLHSSPHTQAHSLGYTLHSSLFTFHSPTCQHRAICKSPLQQNAKALMLIWDNHSSLFTPPLFVFFA